jgi:superfamily II DNA or RNA helicase
MEAGGANMNLPEGRWPNQRRAFDGVLDAIQRGVKRLCVTSPTGSGKSLSMVDVIQWAVEQNEPTALYTQRKMLYDQTAGVLEKAGIDFGRRASGHERALLRNVQLCMTPSELSQVYKAESRELHRASRVLIDEAHCQTGGAMQRIMQDHVAAGATIIGYTATPLDLERLYDELLVAGTVSECFAIKALVPAETYAPDEPDLKHIRKYQVGEDLSEADNVKAIMRPGIFGRVVKAWKQHNPEQKPTLLFAPGVKESIWFAEQFTAAGIRAAHIDGTDTWIDGECHGTDQESRQLIVELLQAGDIKVVCNRYVLREGIDLPFIECGIFATVFGGLTSYIQSGGRLLRACKDTGKEKAIVLDHGGNWHRHGSLNEDREWTLGLTNHRVVGERAEKLREKKQAEPIVCPECGKVRAGGRTCPACGFVAHKKSRMVVQIDGTLRPVDGDVYRPRRVRHQPNEQQLWEKMYYRMKRAGRTFRQAEALYCVENHGWPPRDLSLMPKDSSDWWRKVADVPRENLI